EIERCAAPIGKQDQYIAAYGGLQFIQFNPDDGVFVDPVICRPQTRQLLQERLLMLYTGAQRKTADVLREQQANTERDAARRQSLRRITLLHNYLMSRAAWKWLKLDGGAARPLLI
ncbi:MAG: hypothetical protein LH649_10945, partial [Pseudanabaena sp. CAN_BIN31]|nr:hypothetical protein [Pseudanabaena sp. CAN_BIN31]